MSKQVRAALLAIEERFTSANKIPVDRATVLASEWRALRQALADVEEATPLTREQIAAAVRPLYQNDQIAEAAMVYDVEIARAVERAHGITEKEKQ